MKKELSEQAKSIRNQYQRSWRRRNADKMRNYNANYWEKKVLIQEDKSHKQDSRQLTIHDQT